MSSTGHYTRYINQYPGWTDNNDTMVHHFPDFPGYFQVEHFPGNKRAFAVYNSFDYGGNNAPGSRFHLHVYEYKGIKAIQHTLEVMQNFPREKLIDMILKNRFYNRSYMDYFGYYQEVSE